MCSTGLVITKQSIGVASRSEGFDGVDGIVGIGPVDLTLGTRRPRYVVKKVAKYSSPNLDLDTLSPDTRNTIPTVTDNLFSQGDCIAMSL